MRNSTISILVAAGLAAAAPVRAQRVSDATVFRLHQRSLELAAQAASLAPQATVLASHLAGLEGSLGNLEVDLAGRFGPEAFATDPPSATDRQDPADSLYRDARDTLNRGSYTRAAYLFGQIRQRYPRSTYAADSYYWEAFAHYRAGSSGGMTTAQNLLREQAEKAPNAATRRDADQLASRIRGQQARRGDAEAARETELMAREAGRERSELERETERARSTADRARDRSQRGACRDDDDERMAALNALMQMDSERALPILKRVMARRDEGSVCLRRKAVFLISQHEGKEAETMLLEAVRSDPDREVREQGVFWLSQVRTETAVAALDSVLRASQDQAIQEKAIFALSQHDSPRAQRALQDYARRTTAPLALRENAVFWLGQSSRADNGEFLRTLYGSVSESSLKEKIIFSLAQRGNREDARWLLQIAANASENVEIRKKAVFWAAQSGGIDLPELFTLYDQARDRELKEQLIFAYSQSSHKGAVDKLIDIAKTDSDRELRKKALFWLTQTKDPRVPQLIADIIDKP